MPKSKSKRMSKKCRSSKATISRQFTCLKLSTSETIRVNHFSDYNLFNAIQECCALKLSHAAAEQLSNANPDLDHKWLHFDLSDVSNCGHIINKHLPTQLLR